MTGRRWVPLVLLFVTSYPPLFLVTPSPENPIFPVSLSLHLFSFYLLLLFLLFAAPLGPFSALLPTKISEKKRRREKKTVKGWHQMCHMWVEESNHIREQKLKLRASKTKY